MNIFAENGFDQLQSLSWLKLIIDVGLKSTMVLIVFGSISLLLHRATASLRSRIWTFSLLMLILLPFFSIFTPLWRLPLIPDIAPNAQETATMNTADTAQSRLQKHVALHGADADNRPAPSESVGLASFWRTLSGLDFHWSAWMLMGWVLGAVLISFRFVIGKIGRWCILNKARPEDNDSWRVLAGQTAVTLGINRKVRLLKSDLIGIAMTYGILKPAIIIPAGADKWTIHWRRVALLHETAHIKRLDSLGEWLAKAVVTIYWFNPFVWLAVRKLRVERERACDDIVLNLGTKPSDYATQLMEVAANLGASPGPFWQATAITQGSNLKDRLLCILNPRINRKAERRLVSGIMILFLSVFVLPISVFHLWAPTHDPGNLDNGLFYQDPAGLTRNTVNVSDVLDALIDDNARIRSKACLLLTGIERDRIGEIVYAALTHPDRVVREKALDLLADKDQYRVTALLKKRFDSSEPMMRERIQKELKRLTGRKTDEAHMNNQGYQLLKKGKVEQAVQMFRINVDAFPESSNAYDSLGEAYLIKGDRELAIKNYLKSLELNPDNSNAVKMLKKLKHKNTPQLQDQKDRKDAGR